MLTEKQKSFCREYFVNGGNGTKAYLSTYDSKNEVVAANEASVLLKRDDIQEYLKTINKPLEDKAISEREKKRAILWDRIQVCIDNNDDAAVARYMDILNKMDAEYININKNIEDKAADIKNLDTTLLEKLARPS